MPLVVFFALGFVVAQAGWWYAASGMISAAALGSESAFRFWMAAGVEVLCAALAFGAALAFTSRASAVPASRKACFVAIVAGATTSTVAAGPFALLPHLLQGEAQFIVYFAAAALAGLAFGVLVGMAFREPAVA